MRVILLCFLFFSVSVAAQEPEKAPFLAVQGRAEMRVVPDLFPVVVTIADKALEPAKAQESVESAARQVIDAAQSLKLQDKDIELGNVQIRPEFKYDDAGKETFLGTNYTRNIRLSFHRLADLKSFLGKIPSSKLIRLQTEEFGVADTAAARRVLFQRALQNARESADFSAQALGKRVIGVQTASDQPLALSRGSYINAIDVRSVESTTILTSEQISRMPVPRGITSVHLVGDSNAPRVTEIALSEGSLLLSGNAYVIFLIGD